MFLINVSESKLIIFDFVLFTSYFHALAKYLMDKMKCANNNGNLIDSD